MDDHDWLAQRFEDNRPHLRAVAFRILGSLSDAEDAVQEAWLRLSRSDTSDVDNLAGWLTTVVARVSLNMLQTRKSRREEPTARSCPTTSPAAPRRSPIAPSPRLRRCSLTRSALRCWSSWTPSTPLSGWRSCCTTCSRCPSMRSHRSWAARRQRRGS
ncbi:MAG: hypothetical protein QOI26_1630, partial [Pseudonocardiales bacterium]|nr:hypothetical protein [Pseudonocardiales bacterium]